MAKRSHYLSRFLIFFLVVANVVLLLWILVHGKQFLLLNPKGTIAHQEKQLFLFVFFFGLSLIIPTVFLFYFFAVHYGDKHQATKHNPDVSGDIRLQSAFWIFSSLIVAFLIGLIWISTHALDPFKELKTSEKPMTIQVVSLQWKWLFIYPKEHIATVNYVAFPEKTPVTFELTAESPMNSFWIPQLGGQMYAMEGMVNRTHLMADTIGEFPGSTAEISGKGFAGMRFTARAMKKNDFQAWVSATQNSQSILNWKQYKSLAKPSTDNKPVIYTLTDDNLYNEIVTQFLAPSQTPKSRTLGAHDMNMDNMQGM